MTNLTDSSLRKLLIALAVYITSLLAANVLGIKIMPFFFESHLTVGIFMFPVVFLMTDVVGELYGKRIAKLFVLAGIVSTLLFMGYSLLSLWMPWAQRGLWAQEGYQTIFSTSLRIAFASVVAFIIAEYQDVFSFFFLRARLGTGFFWFRSLCSNLWSQLLDTTIFMLVAFVGIYPTDMLLSLIITGWLYKVCMGMFYTPLSYLGLWLLRDRTVITS